MTDDEAKSKPESRVKRNDDGSITVTMPDAAVIKSYSLQTILQMPRGQGLDGYRYLAYRDGFSDNGDGTVKVTLGKNDSHTVSIRRRGVDMRISAEDAARVFEYSPDEAFYPRYYDVEVPPEGVLAAYDTATKIRMPYGGKYGGGTAVISNEYKSAERDDGGAVFRIPDYRNFNIRVKTDEYVISCEEFAEELKEGAYKRRSKWVTIEQPKDALIRTGEKKTFLKMPKGRYSGYAYGLPNNMVSGPYEDGKLTIRVPDGFMFELKSAGGGRAILYLSEFRAAVEGKTKADFSVSRPKPVPAPAAKPALESAAAPAPAPTPTIPEIKKNTNDDIPAK